MRLGLFFPEILLTLAALLKTHQLATTPFSTGLLLHSRAFSIAMVELELFTVAWLISGFASVQARRCGIVLFGCLSIAAIALVWRGEHSCGCFGVVTVNPWVTVALDVVALGCLLVRSKFEKRASCRSHRRELAAGLVVGLMGLVLIPILNLRTARLSDVGQIVGAGVIVLEPGKWLGKPFPLMDYVSCANEVEHGRWRVVLFREECPKCQAEIEAARSNNGLMPIPVAFVEVPPHQSIERKPTRQIRWCNLAADQDWFVETPVIIFLENGKVVK